MLNDLIENNDTLTSLFYRIGNRSPLPHSMYFVPVSDYAEYISLNFINFKGDIGTYIIIYCT